MRSRESAWGHQSIKYMVEGKRASRKVDYELYKIIERPHRVLRNGQYLEESCTGLVRVTSIHNKKRARSVITLKCINHTCEYLTTIKVETN